MIMIIKVICLLAGLTISSLRSERSLALESSERGTPGITSVADTLRAVFWAMRLLYYYKWTLNLNLYVFPIYFFSTFSRRLNSERAGA